MKKITKILLIGCISLLLAFGFVGCKKDCEHVYDNACDVTCNECNEERTITHTPNADDGDCTTAITCVCGAVTTEGKTAHDFSEVTYDDYNHYNKCSNCTTIENEEGEKHVFDKNYDCECGVVFTTTLKIDEDDIIKMVYNTEGVLVYEYMFYVESYCTYYYDGNGNRIKEIYTDSEGGSSTTEYEYDENRNLVKESYSNPNGYSNVRIYEYDENGNCIKKTYTDSDDDNVKTTEYEYDDNGNCVKEIFINSYGESLVYIYEYDENGNLVKETYTFSEDYGDVHVYEYDENGNLVKEIWSDSDDNGSTTEYEYNENGQCIKETQTYSDGDTSTTEYEYDKNGNCIKETINVYGYTIIEYKYDDDNNCVKITYSDSDGYVDVYE